MESAESPKTGGDHPCPQSHQNCIGMPCGVCGMPPLTTGQVDWQPLKLFVLHADGDCTRLYWDAVWGMRHACTDCWSCGLAAFEVFFARRWGLHQAGDEGVLVSGNPADAVTEWARCDRCEKWRRLSTPHPAMDDKFECRDTGKSCHDSEDEFDEDDEDIV